MTEPRNDDYKEKYRPDETTLDKQVEDVLGETSLEKLYGFDKPGAQPGAAGAPAPNRGLLRGAVKGKVTALKRDDVFVDLGDKNQGIAPVTQFEQVMVGDEIEFVVERYDRDEDLYILSKKGAVAQSVSWESLEVGQVVEGTVTGMNKGGLELQIKTLRAFMPSGQVDVNFVKDISVLIGQRMTVEVARVDRDKKNLIVSRRAILERDKEQAREKLMTEMGEGQVRRGIVRTVMDYGAFVDLGGVDGLLHVSEMSHRRIRNPKDMVTEGDVVEVKITKIDPETGKISLSLKQAMADPWSDASARYAVGTSVTARVARVEGFGAFLEVEEGIEGLLPVSEMSYQRIRHPADVVKVGDTLKVVVLNMDPTQHKLTFSLKQAGPDPWSEVADRYPLHSVQSAKVTRVVDFGAFCELEPGIEGLCHISELAPNRVRTANDAVTVGQDVKVRVLEVDKDKRRVSLSIKRASEPAPAPVAAAAPAAEPAKKKKRPQLRGGLDF